MKLPHKCQPKKRNYRIPKKEEVVHIQLLFSYTLLSKDAFTAFDRNHHKIPPKLIFFHTKLRNICNKIHSQTNTFYTDIYYSNNTLFGLHKKPFNANRMMDDTKLLWILRPFSDCIIESHI